MGRSVDREIAANEALDEAKVRLGVARSTLAYDGVRSPENVKAVKDAERAYAAAQREAKDARKVRASDTFSFLR